MTGPTDLRAAVRERRVRRSRVPLRRARCVLLAVAIVAAGCSSDDDEQRSTSTTTAETLSDAEAIAIARDAIEEEGLVTDLPEREPFVVRSEDVIDVAFVIGTDEAPVVGGEPHATIDAETAEVLDVFMTR